MSSLEDRLLGVFQAAFPGTSDEELRKVEAATFDDWDSFATVTVISLVQEEFNLEIASEDMHELLSFDQIFVYLTRQQ